MLVQCVEYVFGIQSGYELRDTPEVVFKMVRPSLDSDIAKYAERCERNQRNAKSQSQRVGASGSQSQPVAANTTTTTTPTTTPTTTTTASLSPDETEQRDRWLIYGYFWSVGSKAIKEELNAFWSYYEALGWKNNKGAAIVSRLACARMWKRSFETGTAPNGADAWFRALQACAVYDYNVWHAYAGAERCDDHVLVRVRCSGQFLADLRAAVPTLEKDLRALWRAPEIRFQPI